MVALLSAFFVLSIIMTDKPPIAGLLRAVTQSPVTNAFTLLVFYGLKPNLTCFSAASFLIGKKLKNHLYLHSTKQQPEKWQAGQQSGAYTS